MFDGLTQTVDGRRPTSACLFFPCRPTTILWRIRAILIWPAVERMLKARSQPHVGEEIRKIVPSFTDYNSTPAPIFIAGSLGIAAARMHARPRTVFRRAPSTMFKGELLVTPDFIMKAPARTCISFSQIVSISNKFISTITKTKPARICINRVHKGDRSQTCEALVYDVHSRHALL